MSRANRQTPEFFIKARNRDFSAKLLAKPGKIFPMTAKNMDNKWLYYAACLLSLGMNGCMAARDKSFMKPLTTVAFVDLERYAGRWFEIARYRNRFQDGCVGSSATYTLRDDGKLTVVNECYDKSFSGRLRSVKGKAWVVDSRTNAKLKVSFFWPFAGDYWIIDLGPDYEYAVVGHPDRKYLWVLARAEEMDETLYQTILKGLKQQQYDTTKLIKTTQPKKEAGI